VAERRIHGDTSHVVATCGIAGCFQAGERRRSSMTGNRAPLACSRVQSACGSPIVKFDSSRK
jgi:hypothetical protein